MKLIEPAEISGSIMTLIDKAVHEVIIVSPYNKVSEWKKFTLRINKAQKRGIGIKWYTRANNVSKQNSQEVKDLGIEPILIDNLHAKLYLNDKQAIITSMNLNESSDEKSLDIGYLTETEHEYKEIHSFIATHIEETLTPGKKAQYKNEKILNEKPKKDIESTPKKKIKPISKCFYINRIHEHITLNYVGFNYYEIVEDTDNNYLRYFDFLKRDASIEFVPYQAAIKIAFYIPQLISAEHVYERIVKRGLERKLMNSNEFYYSNVEDEFLKYYYVQKPFKKLVNWREAELKGFLNNLDTFIKIIYSEINR